MAYCVYDDIYRETGMTLEFVMEFTELAQVAVEAMLADWIAAADAKINMRVNIPITVHREEHCGTGETDEFDLGAEDELGFYEEYDPADNTVMAFACYFNNYRKKRPYPKDCDMTESIAADCAVSNAAATDETTIVGCGSNSLKVVYSGAGYVRYPDIATVAVLNKNIDIFKFVSFRFRSSSAAVTFQLRLYDRSGSYNYIEFSVDRADNMFIFHFDLDNEFIGAIDWDDTRLYYWQLHADAACTVYIDNFNFNDGWFITAPQGKLCIAHMMDFLPSPTGVRHAGDEPIPEGYEVKLSYSINPFLSSTPANIRDASAKLAGVELINHLIGVRQRDTAFLVEGETLITDKDKETMYHTRTRLLREARLCIADYGYGFEFVPVDV